MKIRPETLVETWAKRPDVFELEPEHVRTQYGALVEAKRKELETPDPPAEDEPKPKAKKAPAKTTAKKAEPKGD